MKQPFFPMSARLLLINFFVFLFMIGVVAVMFSSFDDIEQIMGRIIQQDVTQVISNASIGRSLTEVFADISYLLDRFLDEKTLLSGEGERLVQKLETVIKQPETVPGMRHLLEDFLHTFRDLLDKGTVLIAAFEQLQQIDCDLETTLDALETYSTNTIIIMKMERQDVEKLEQFAREIPWYQETRLQANLLLVTLVRKFQQMNPSGDTQTTDRDLLQLLVLLDEFDARLQFCTISDPAIIIRTQHLLDVARTYKTEIILFSQESTVFQQYLNTLNDIQVNTLSLMEAFDHRISNATENMQQEMADVMSSSRLLALLLSAVMLIIMMIGWLTMQWMIRPLLQLSHIADQLAQGELENHPKSLPRNTSNDEIGILSRAFTNLYGYMREVATTAIEISQGNISHTLHLRSSNDVLGQAFQQMSLYLHDLAVAATAIANGDLYQDIQPKTEHDVLGNAFHQMAIQLDDNFHTISTQLQEIQRVSDERERLLHDLQDKNSVLQGEIIERKRAEKELQQYREHLEELVKARTAELENAVTEAKRLNENLREEVVERKRAEHQLQQAKQAVEEALQEAKAGSQAKSEFLAHMSHELRTPLNGILGYAQILQHDHTLREHQREAVDIMERSGEHLLTMINNILDLSRIEAGKKDLTLSSFYLPELVRTVADIGRVQARQKNIGFHVHLDPALQLTVYGDTTRLHQILLNLIGNALTFTLQGGVTFGVKKCDTPDAPPGTHTVRFRIEDTGIGIPPENLHAIFEPFRQVQQPSIQSKGIGLGLAISQRLVHMMGAELHVESVPDQGSTFWFDVTLPEGEDQIMPSKEPSQRIIGIKGEPCKVLLVDDKTENLALLRDALLPLGFKLAEAVNGRNALEKVREFHPDVILMDLIMPEMDGFEATRQIRQNPLSRDTVVIAVSASAFDHTRQQSLAAGCDDFLVKPVRIDQLLVRLQTYLKLEWVYRHDTLTNHDFSTARNNPEESSFSEQHFVPPPEKDLSVLFDCIKKGDLMAIAPHLDHIEQLDQKYLPFVVKIRQLAHEFRLDELEALISRYIKA